MDRINKWYTTINNTDEGYKQEQDRWYSETYDDSNWSTMIVLQSFEGTELENINGCMWFRKEIYLLKYTENLKGKLLLGVIVDWDAVYINGIKHSHLFNQLIIWNQVNNIVKVIGHLLEIYKGEL